MSGAVGEGPGTIGGEGVVVLTLCSFWRYNLGDLGLTLYPRTVSNPMEPKAKQSDPDVDDGSPTDGQLVGRVLDGDRKAFDELIVRYQRQAVAVSYRLLGNTQDALEVTQDAFLKAFTSLATLQKAEAFGGWLMRIVSNLSLNFRRGRKNRQQLPLDDLLGPSEPSNMRAASA